MNWMRTEKGLNDQAEVDCCRRTMGNVKRKCEAQKKEVHPTNAGRIAAFNKFDEGIAIAQDGASGQIKVIENSLHCQDTEKMIIWAKYAGGYPNLRMTKEQCIPHCILFLNLQISEEMIEPTLGLDQSEEYFEVLNCFSSFNTVWKCFRYSRVYLSKAFNGSIERSFSAAGIPSILNQCPLFGILSKENAESHLI
jgi:hypothetical protein